MNNLYPLFAGSGMRVFITVAMLAIATVTADVAGDGDMADLNGKLLFLIILTGFRGIQVYPAVSLTAARGMQAPCGYCDCC